MNIPTRLALTVSSLALAAGSVFAATQATQATQVGAAATTAVPQSVAFNAPLIPDPHSRDR
jgi:hypothetical protein